MNMRIEPGQAVVELCLGLVAILIVVSALCYFSRHMTKSLEVQNHLRQDGATYSARIMVDEPLAKELLGRRNIDVNEPHGAVSRTIPESWVE